MEERRCGRVIKARERLNVVHDQSREVSIRELGMCLAGHAESAQKLAARPAVEHVGMQRGRHLVGDEIIGGDKAARCAKRRHRNGGGGRWQAERGGTSAARDAARVTS